MAQHGAYRTGPGTPSSASPIPDKLYFRIGEVARLCAVPTYVLRFWESEFPQLKPNKGGTGQRLYRRRDVEMALSIRTLLYEEGFTIPGARQALKAEQRQPEPQLSLEIVDGGRTPATDRKALLHLRKDLHGLLELLSSPAPRPGRTARAVHPIRPGLPRPSSDDLFG